MKTSEELKAITCTPDGVVVAFGKADNKIMQKAIDDVVAMESALAERDKRIAELEKELSKEKALTVYAIERRDAKIMELEELVEKMKQCDNCQHDRRQDEEDSPCVGCNYYSNWSPKP